jgi:hypothetical protein
MCVEHIRKSMDLSERETIGPLILVVHSFNP